MIKVVIFDLDDTLIDTSNHIVDALKHVYIKNKRYLGVPLNFFLSVNKREIIRLVGNRKIRVNQIGYLIWFRIFETLGINASPFLVDKFFNDFQNYILSHISLKIGVSETLDFLKTKKIKIAVLSNGSFDEKIKKIMAVKIDKKINILVTSELVKDDKPEPSSLIYLVNKSGFRKNEILYIGDSYKEDVLLARSFGLKTIYFNENGDKKVKKSSSYFMANNYFQIMDILKDLIV
jgi:HAD superfamily hydrolase (TIGR01549 family)